ncbi:conserved hypothetical protein [Afipia carboxidovorans OM5]|uniref:Porin n=2 Tax=Afipia carboxidovorans TaxID=40137 RepID=B6JIY8_AFIC5|nr:TorF family putative porin [Afipia carboxidovorans]ACI94382.1 conserved hypothetical protein [Afipia carboxidovorans OM5]AEI01983.1 hypothetical protein OCA4_c08360 [Afipia carboxidovorans OM4]AEI05559.1 hypothetical protein OCA5_c08370 [Afipia carboxidovorans OM5]
MDRIRGARAFERLADFKKGVVMKLIFPAAAAVIAGLAVQTAAAADLPATVYTKAPPVVAFDPWDIAFGAGVMSDYVFRGITQSNHKPSVTAYFEPRYNFTKDLQIYVGTSFESISFPNRAAAEVDIYGGIRPTFGALALDFGVWGYLYPGGTCVGNGIPGSIGVAGSCGFDSQIVLANGNFLKKDVSFYEVYGKATYTFNDSFAMGGNVFYTPSFLNSGADGTYASVTAKVTAPGTFLPNGVGAYVSGEFGRQWLGVSDSFYGNTNYRDYNTWNVGIGFTYKVFTLDLRYSDTDLNKGDCNAFTSDYTASRTGYVTSINAAPGFGSTWCGAAFIAKLSADLTLMSNIK